MCDFEKSTKQIHKSADSKHHGHLTLKETTKVKSAITEIRNFGMVIMYDTHEGVPVRRQYSKKAVRSSH